MNSSNVSTHEYRTVTRANFAATGYVRELSATFKLRVPDAITRVCVDYFGYFFFAPSEDTANFVTQKDMESALQFKESANQFMKEKQFDLAVVEYTKALSCNINDSKLRSNRSMCFLKLGNFSRAGSDARHAICNDPLWFKAWLRMAQVFEADEQYAEAIDMIKHALKICRRQAESADKANLKLLKKYRASLSSKLRETTAGPINHELDEDRAEWKDCAFHDTFREKEMSDEDVLTAPPWKLQFYQEAILPTRLLLGLQNDCEDQHGLSEFERWSNRKWIQKLSFFQKINMYKDVFKFDDLVESGNAAFAPGEVWIIGWSANPSLYLDKRVFMISVTCIHQFDPSASKLVLLEDVFCKPNARKLINSLKMAIANPGDTMTRIAEQDIAAANAEEFNISRRPMVVNVQYRIRDEFDEINAEMQKYGIFCRLLPYEEAVRTCKEYDTHPMGWNYLDMQPRYMVESESE